MQWNNIHFKLVKTTLMISFWVSLGLIFIILSEGFDIIPVDGRHKGYLVGSKICLVTWIAILGFFAGKNDWNLFAKIYWVGFGLSLSFIGYWWHPLTQEAVLIDGLCFYEDVAYPNALTKEKILWNKGRILKYKMLENQRESKRSNMHIFKLPRILLISIPILFTIFMIITTRHIEYDFLGSTDY